MTTTTRTTALAVLSLALLAGCATGGGVPIGGASSQAGADFSAYRTFDFLPVPPGSARLLASLEYFGIEGVLSRGFAQVGLARSISGAPDLLVNYYQGGTQVDPRAWGYTTSGDPGIDVAGVPPSCLVVDVVDAATRVLVWRGIATDALVSPQSAGPAVQQMLQAWPGQAR